MLPGTAKNRFHRSVVYVKRDHRNSVALQHALSTSGVVLMRRLRPEWDPSSSFFQIFKTSFGEQWYIPCKRSTLSFLWKWYSWRIEICCTHLLFPEKRVGTSPCLRKASLISGPRTPASFVQSLLVCCAGVSFLPREWFLAWFGFVVQADTVGAQRNLKSKLADRLPTL